MLTSFEALEAETEAPCTCTEVYDEAHYCDPCCESCEDPKQYRHKFSVLGQKHLGTLARALEAAISDMAATIPYVSDLGIADRIDVRAKHFQDFLDDLEADAKKLMGDKEGTKDV